MHILHSIHFLRTHLFVITYIKYSSLLLFQYMIVMIIIVVLEVIAGMLAFAFWPEVCILFLTIIQFETVNLQL